MDDPIVVVGAGVAGVRVVRRLRRGGYRGPLVLVDAQTEWPYDRPPLSKQVLRGERDLPVLLDEEACLALDVDWRGGSRAVGLDAHARFLRLHDFGLVYSTLVIATGSRARRVPSLQGAVLRSYADAVSLRAVARPDATVLVVGAGLIGCEVAASCRARGADVHLADTLPSPTARVTGSILGAEVAALHREHGVVLHLETTVTRTDADGVTLSDGTVLRPDLVLEAVGAEPDLRWLAGSRLVLADGVVCDAEQRTNLKDVYVVGDAAAPLGRRSEHWTAATEQADRAAASILGKPRPADQPPYWWSDQYDLKIQGLGLIDLADEVVIGMAGGGRLGVFGSKGTLVGAVGLGASAALMRLRASIAEGSPLGDAVATLEDPVAHRIEDARPLVRERA
ncbi:NAD(P)/FAD-dependent oxidoreductase [Dactylosporangium sp. CA-233914]|uniref:NAD(P)/FAD-dependent oxidoreductase n=1 Tax=Dactylosporangium sp. CA-233914 TaxID=3239934 RepID=UPI003D8F0CD0